MANDFNINEFKLKDPVSNINDGLKEPVRDGTPGFFSSLRNPLDLMLEESLPASLYQWATGNTKKKQAQEALDYIRNNPQLQGSKIYKEAERKLNRFGYLLDDGPMDIDLKEIGNMIKQSPGLFGAEMVNMVMADPYLLFMPLGWGKLGRGVVNSLRLKYSKSFQVTKSTTELGKLKASAQVKELARLREAAKMDMAIGSIATLGVPFVFSTSYQLGEKGEFTGKRTAAETTIGATAGAIFSLGFAGMGAVIGRNTGLDTQRVQRSMINTLNKNKNLADSVEYTDKGSYRIVDDILNDLKKEVGVVIDEAEFSRIANEVTSFARPTVESAKDIAKNTLFKAASIGGVVGTAQFLTADDDKLVATAKGFGTGVGIYAAAKAATMYFGRSRVPYQSAETKVESALDAAQYSTIRYNSYAQELANKIKDTLPDQLDSRRKVFYYLTGATVDENFRFNKNVKPFNKGLLSDAELNAANDISKIFNEFYEMFNTQGAGIVKYKKSNYLPLLWDGYRSKTGELFSFTNKFETAITGDNPKFKFSRSRVFEDINQGLRMGYTIRPGMDDPAELMRLYLQAAGKSLTTQNVLRFLETNYIGKSTDILTKPFLARTRKQAAFIDPQEKINYTEFNHPFFTGDKGFVPLIHKGIEPSLRMVFDATTEQQLMSALFTTNLMMKRLAVGFSFFHAGALVESLWFAGAKFKTIGKFLSPKTKPEVLKQLQDPGYYLTDYPHAIKQLRAQGYDDVVRFGQGSGLEISMPEDVGYDRFYQNIRGVDTFLKRHFGISQKGNIERTFKFFDRITWDRIFTSAKLHTFLTSLNKGKNAIQPGDTQEQIYKKARRAAQFTNDAYGGQNWAQVTQRIENRFVKNLAQTTLTPGSRGYLQLLLFAPDWTISNIRIIAKSLPGFESDPMARRLYQYYFARAALTYAVAGSALNYMFSGHSILENTDPTRIDLGNGEVLTFSKQLMEPFHWITAPQSTGLKKIGSLPRTVIEVLTNKSYLTTKWSPNMTKKDDEAIEKALKIGGHVGKRFLPIWLQQATASIEQGLLKDGLSLDLAADTSVDFVLGQLGHPRYQGPRYTQYKTKGLVRSPYETLF
nr:hypothetical protein [uncultured Mediterranean phage uvMED]